MSGTASYRLALVCDARELGGAEIFLKTLMAALPSDVDIVLLGPHTSILELIRRGRPRARVETIAPWSVAGCVRALRFVAPDVVHINLASFPGCRPAVVASLLLGFPTVLVDHGPAPGLTWRGRAVQRAMTALVARRISVGERASRSVEQLGGLRPGSVDAIANGIPPLPARGPLGPARGIVGVVARLDPAKGVDVLVRAVARLPDVELQVAGEGRERAALLALAVELGVTDRVRLLGQISEVPTFLAEIDVLAIPSRSEGLPLALLEAMHVGTPVVATDVGSIPDAVTDGETGLLVPAGDPAALADAIGALLGNLNLRRRLAAAAALRARQTYTDRAMAEAYDAVYRSLVGTGRVSRRAQRG